jgi:hypothetical protein
MSVFLLQTTWTMWRPSVLELFSSVYASFAGSSLVLSCHKTNQISSCSSLISLLPRLGIAPLKACHCLPAKDFFGHQYIWHHRQCRCLKKLKQPERTQRMGVRPPSHFKSRCKMHHSSSAMFKLESPDSVPL